MPLPRPQHHEDENQDRTAAELDEQPLRPEHEQERHNQRRPGQVEELGHPGNPHRPPWDLVTTDDVVLDTLRSTPLQVEPESNEDGDIDAHEDVIDDSEITHVSPPTPEWHLDKACSA